VINQIIFKKYQICALLVLKGSTIKTNASRMYVLNVLPEPLKLITLSLNSALSIFVRRESWDESLSSKLMMMTSSFLIKSCFAFVLSKAVLPVPKSAMKMTLFFVSSFRTVYWTLVQKNCFSREAIFSELSSVCWRRLPEKNVDSLRFVFDTIPTYTCVWSC
jgi:hypothetical protein